ncbi:Indole-3-acetate O-methyltransferase 1 [Capsicum annuum]|nr:Indole-3-acetate O-methyltransferase 1 [Capsicum annuum]
MSRSYEAMGQQPPEFSVFFSDLPSNDFNTLFELLPPLANNGYGSMAECLSSNIHRSYFVVGVPVSFYHRLFPARSVDVFYSAFSLQWLSQVFLATRPHNGGLISLDDLCKLLGQRWKAVRETISEDDSLRAISKLKVLGSGFEVITVGKKKLVRSVPTELNKDHNKILELDQVARFGGSNIDLSAWEDKKNPSESRFPSQELKVRPCPVVFASFSGGPKACMYKVLQVPDVVLYNRSMAYNKGRIYIYGANESKAKAYKKQFQSDLADFLCARSKEMKRGGSIFLVFFGRTSVEPTGQGGAGLLFGTHFQDAWDDLVQEHVQLLQELLNLSFGPALVQIHNPEAGGKLRLLCSYGGRTLPRPNNGKLRYMAGEMRIISIRKNLTFDELVRKTTIICNQPHTIKYQLPEEDLDALVSILFDKDLQHMIKEHHDLGKSSQRIGFFLVPSVDSEGPCFFEVITLQLA